MFSSVASEGRPRPVLLDAPHESLRLWCFGFVIVKRTINKSKRQKLRGSGSSEVYTEKLIVSLVKPNFIRKSFLWN